MVIYEDYGANSQGVALTRAYSDRNMMIARDGVEYEEAIDPTELGRTYTETEHTVEEITDAEYAEAGKILLGVTK